MVTFWWNRFLKSLSRPAAPRRPERVQLEIESLETRLVPTVFTNLNGGQLVVSTDNADNVTINHSGSFTLVNQFAVPDAAITNGIHVQGGFANVSILGTVKPLTTDSEQIILVGTDLQTPGNMQNILAPLSLGSAVAVQLDDSTDPTGQNITLNVVNEVVNVTGMAGAPISINVFGGLLGDQDLQVFQLFGGRGHNTFNILDTPAAIQFFTNVTTTGIFTGPAGDTVNLRGTSSAELDVEGKARDTVTIGNHGNLDAIQGEVDVSNPPSFTGLIVDGSAAGSSQNVTLSIANGIGTIHGLAPADIMYHVADVSEVIVEGGSHGNTFTVQDTFRNPSFSNTLIETGAGSNLINVLGTTGSLDVFGQGGRDTVNIGAPPPPAPLPTSGARPTSSTSGAVSPG